MTKPKKPEPPKSAEQVVADNLTMSEALEDYNVYVNALATSLWDNDDPGHDLTVEEMLFCRSYIIDRNPVAALRRLNYGGSASQLKAIAEKHLAVAEVSNCIDTLAGRLMAKLDITAERVQRRIAAVAFFDPRSVAQFDGIGVRLLNSKFWSEEQIWNIKGVKMGNNGIEIQFHDGLRAAEMLAKQLGVQPPEGIEATAAAARAAGEAVVQKIFDIFDKEYPEEASPPPALLQ